MLIIKSLEQFNSYAKYPRGNLTANFVLTISSSIILTNLNKFHTEQN